MLTYIHSSSNYSNLTMLNCVYHLNDKIVGYECYIVSKTDEYMTILMWDHRMVNWVCMVNVGTYNVQAMVWWIYIYYYKYKLILYFIYNNNYL